jgi:hypothetical protein
MSLPNSSNKPAIVGRQITPHFIRDLVRTRNYIALCQILPGRFQRVLGEMFYHENRDGSGYTPRIVDVEALPPYYLAIKLDAQALWHFSKEQLTSPKVLDALSTQAYLPVRALPFQPGVDITYVVILVNLQSANNSQVQVDVAKQLPKSVLLDVGSKDLTGKLLVPIGVSAHGPVWRALSADAKGIGHTMIAGETGAGKTTWEHAALAALLTQNTPQDIQVALIDPKRNELSLWREAPHVYGYCYDGQDAEHLLADVEYEVKRRGGLLNARALRNINSYNARVKTEERLPYLLVVADECMELVSEEGKLGKAIQEHLRTIATVGRAFGVIFWAATTHTASLNGLDRRVNTNLTSRLVFRVMDAHAAQSAGCPGAQAIPKGIPGRMLAKLDDAPQWMQSFYLDEDAIVAMANRVSGKEANPGGQPQVTLSEEDKRLLQRALDESRGELTLKLIHEWTGQSAKEASQVLFRLRGMGVLFKDKNADNRHRVNADVVGGLLGRVSEKP